MTTENKKVYILQKDLSSIPAGIEFFEGGNYYANKYLMTHYIPKEIVESVPTWFKLKETLVIKQEKLFTLRDAENIFTDSRLKETGTIYNVSGYKYDNFLHYMQVNYGDIPTSKTFSEPWDKL